MWNGDAGYHSRHYKRSISRAERIACHIRLANRFLDVGCNEGVVSEYLLKSGKVKKAVGVELSDVEPSLWLRKNNDFELIKNDIQNITFDESFDCVFYGAVHHHLVRESGIVTALEVFKKIASVCTGKIYFETGQLTEGSRWKWQREINNYFSSDEEHIWYLLQSIEPILTGFKVVGKYFIHGVPRYLCEISVDGNRDDLSLKSEYFFDQNKKKASDLCDAIGKTDLLLIDYMKSDIKPTFRKISYLGKSFFIKKRYLLPHVDFLEYKIGSSVEYDWAVSPVLYTEKGIIFPWIDGIPLSKVNKLSPDLTICLQRQLDLIVKNVFTKTIKLPPSLLYAPVEASLAAIVDFNINNFIVNGDRIRVVDFEYHSSNTIARNYVNFSRAYFKLGAFMKGVVFLSRGLVKEGVFSFKSIFFPFEIRALKRRPSLFWWVFIKMRNLFDRFLIKMLPFYSEQ